MQKNKNLPYIIGGIVLAAVVVVVAVFSMNGSSNLQGNLGNL